MKILPSEVITSIADAEFLLQASVISYDIETNTKPTSLQWLDYADKYGLSYVADITDVAFFTPGHPPVVLDMHGYPEDTCNFIRRVFDRTNFTLIAHNNVFDARSLGGHLGFTLQPGVRVWDTQVMSIRLTISDGADDESDGGSGSKAPPLNFQSSSLQNLLALHNIITDQDEKEFLAFMKGHRAMLADMDSVIPRLWPEHVVWRVLGENSYEMAQQDETRPAIVTRLVNLYVALDAVSTYYLYERQVEIANQITAVQPLQPGEVKARSLIHEVAPNVKIPSWPNVGELLGWEMRIGRVLANQAIRGVKLDIPYTNKLLAREVKRHQEFGEFVRNFPDKSDRIPNWSSQFMMVWWYDMIVKAVTKEPSEKHARGWKWGTYSTPKEGQNWQYDPTFDVSSLDPYLGHPDERWILWLKTITPDMSAAMIRKNRPEGDAPELNLLMWVMNHSTFTDQNALVVRYKAMLKLKYWKAWVEDDEGKLPEDFNSFTPYMIFVKAEMPFPDDHDLRYIVSVKTKSFMDQVLYAKDENGEKYIQDEDDVLEEALYWGLNNPKLCPFSAGHHAIMHLGVKELGWDEDEMEQISHPAAQYWKFLRAEARMQTLEMFLRHASRDGRIHTMMQRARTGRNRSQQPNIQNLHMEDYAGILVADDGFWLVGLDYTNAENKSGAAISRDNAFARATEEGDFHMNMAWTYKPAEMAQLEREGKRGEMRKLRKKLKSVTFAVPYGAGAAKIAEQLIASIDEAKAILEARQRAFPMAERAKEDWQAKVEKMFTYNNLWVPFITNWAGARIRVPVTNFYGKVGPKKNAVWNYLQQSSVADLVLRAMTTITEEWEDYGLESWIPFNVHDELVVAVRIPEYYEVVQRACAIMNHTFPLEWARRTVPAVHNVADHGPSNYLKWGYTENIEDYPFELYEFINEWGVFPIEEKDRTADLEDQEHPTWLGPVHQGWTLAQEILDIAAGDVPEDCIGLPKERVIVAEETQADVWDLLEPAIEYVLQIGANIDKLVPVLTEITDMPKPVVWAYKDKVTGEPHKVTASTPSMKLRVMTELAAKGYMVDTYNRYMQALEDMSKLRESLDKATQLLTEAKNALEAANTP